VVIFPAKQLFMPRLKVIRASAGSGKTFTLAHEYLRLLFTDTGYFKHILAVTFTNKATNEMKSRIVRELHLLANDKPSLQLDSLLESTGLQEHQLRTRAAIVLKKLLHQYSAFSVYTIDAFFQRIIRSFTRELGIQGAYSIELDTDTLLNEVINRLMVKAETDKSLLAWLTRYAESLIEKGENWNFRKGIWKLGREIFREEFNTIGEDTMNELANRSMLQQIQSELIAGIRSVEKDYRLTGSKAMHLIESSGLTVDDFSRKSSGPAGFLEKLRNGEFKEPTAIAMEAATNIEKWYTKNSPHQAIISELGNNLMTMMQEAVEYYEKRHLHYFTFEVGLQNLFTLGILADLSHLADEWCKENNSFLLPEAPVFVNKIIDGNDTPFIYEKAGTWFHHFMIDEFQDTSWLQWQNFKPLISNSLSQNFDNLVVGDVKQSIYRWRNSNWEILDHRLQEDFPENIVENLTLGKNWRSGARVIHFNNLFFKAAAAALQDEFNSIADAIGKDCESTITELYADVQQQLGSAEHNKGIVEVRFLEGSNTLSYADIANSELIRLLCSLQDQGYALRDIAIITRKNKEAKQLADFLIDYGNNHPGKGYRFDVISEEALRLGSSSLVAFLVSLLQYMVNKNDRLARYYILVFYKNHLSNETAGDWISPANNEDERKDEFNRHMPAPFLSLADQVSAFSLAETIERLVCIFNLRQFKGESVYLQAFRDLVNEYNHNFNGDPALFLEYWNETGREKSVSAPSGQDALRILTIHKSKGLEFSIVILPYCTWELNTFNNSILWCKPTEPPLNRLEKIPLTYSPRLIKTSFAGAYYEECLKQYIDNLNLLYVAFTRARTGLYVYCKKRKNDQMKTVSDVIYKVFSGAGNGLGSLLKQDSGNQQSTIADLFSTGNLPAASEPQPASQDYNLPSSGVDVITADQRIRIAFQGKIYLDKSVNMPRRPLHEGRILHEVFTSVRTPRDVVPSVTSLYLQGLLTFEEKEKYITLITHLMNDIQVLSWFSDEWKVLAEAEIILPQKGSRRPDRVMVKKGQTLIIDYKFGKPENHHHNQLKEYAELLVRMGYENIEAWLWYVILGKVVKVV